MFNLKSSGLKKLRDQNPYLVSYNVEMTEVTGGTFWKAYTEKQISGEESFAVVANFSMGKGNPLMQWYEPVDLNDERLRKLTSLLGSAYCRVSGSWATKTYYDFSDNPVKEKEGFQAVLTKRQWLAVLDFVRDLNLKLLVSLGNCKGNHLEDGSYDMSQPELLFKTSAEYGVPIAAVEFMNEPNPLQLSGAPEGYDKHDYVRDQDLVMSWVKKNYPDCLCVGPCTVASMNGIKGEEEIKSGVGGGIMAFLGNICMTEDLLEGTKEKLDVYSYHYYNGISERMASMMPDSHWDASQALTKKYLDVASNACKANIIHRDKYVPNAEMWVTESGDAGGGGNTWASTYLDVFRTLNELGSFSQLTQGIIFHNTLCSSDYGYLAPESFEPRPNYFAVYLWNKLMGSEVYEANIEEDFYIYAHSRKDGKEGVAYLIINTSDEAREVNLEKKASVYALSATDLRAKKMKLNGQTLDVDEHNDLVGLNALECKGNLKIEGKTCVFVVI